MSEETRKKAVELSDAQAEMASGGGAIGALDGVLEGNVLIFTCHKCGKQNTVTLTNWVQPPCQYCGHINGSGPIGTVE